MIDFKKRMTPEYREKAKKDRLLYEEKIQRQVEANKFMLRKLEGYIDQPEYSEWERNFIFSVSRYINVGDPLTEKQQVVLERIFEK